MTTAYRHSYVVQLCPIQGPYYRVVASYGEDGPPFWKERVEALALVDEWVSNRPNEAPDEDDDVERCIRTVRLTDGYFEAYDPGDDQFIGFYWKEELDDEVTVRYIEAEAKAKREAFIRRQEKRTTGNVGEAANR
jgi:hypothetical protein